MSHAKSLLVALVALALLARSADAQEPARPMLTLRQAIERAELVQPPVVQALTQVRTADARIRSAKGAWLPNLTANSSLGDFFSEGQRIDPSTGQLTTSGATNRSINGSLSSSLELFDGFRRSAESRSARANRDAAEASLSNAKFQQQLTTTNQFFDVLAAAQLARVREASVRRAEEQLKVSIARLRAGAGIRPDSLRSLVTLGNAQLQLIAAQTQLATAEANLGRLVGLEGPAGAVDDSSYYRIVPALDTTKLRAEAVAQAPQVQSAQASARSARSGVAVARAGYWPSVSLSGSASLNGSRLTDYNFLQQRQIQLGLTWPLFNRFTREQNIANQLASADLADATAGESRRQVQANLTSGLAALEAARLKIGITLISVVAATEDLRVQQERFRLGAATIVEVVTSQEALAQAEVDAVTARFDYLRAKAQIEALIGREL